MTIFDVLINQRFTCVPPAWTRPEGWYKTIYEMDKEVNKNHYVSGRCKFYASSLISASPDGSIGFAVFKKPDCTVVDCILIKLIGQGTPKQCSYMSYI